MSRFFSTFTPYTGLDSQEIADANHEAAKAELNLSNTGKRRATLTSNPGTLAAKGERL